MERRQRQAGYTGIPRWIYAIAAAGGLFVLLPLAAMVARVNWPQFIPLITSESSLTALGPEPADLGGEHRPVHRLRRAAGLGAGPSTFPGQRLLRAFVLLPLVLPPGGGRHRPALHLRPPGPAGPEPGGRRDPDRVLDDGGGPRPDVRGPAVPGGQPGGRAAHRRRPVRGRGRNPRSPAHHRAAPRHPAAGAARPGLRGRAVLRAEPRRIRRDADLRGQPAGGDPDPAAGNLPAAGNGRRRRRRAFPGAGGRRRGRGGADVPAAGRRRAVPRPATGRRAERAAPTAIGRLR